MKLERVRTRVTPALLHGRIIRKTRRVIAAGLLVAAAALAVSDGAVAAPAGTPTVIADRAVPAGDTLEANDLRVVRFPAKLRPDDALRDPGEVTGQTASGALAAGEAITMARLLRRDSQPPGTSTAPIRLADAGVAHLLDPGTEVAVVTLGDDTDQARELTAGATVLTVTDNSATT